MQMQANIIMRARARLFLNSPFLRSVRKPEKAGMRSASMPGNIVTQQGFVVSDAIRPEYTDEELKNEQAMMDKLTEERNEQYNEFVKDITPTHSLIRQMVHAFIVGGIVCVIGQAIINAGIAMGLDDKTAGSWCSLILVLISVLLTGFNLFYRIAKFAGAGILVPITGFANGVASSAIEYKKEGQVFGIGCKIFTIAGLVILYGIFATGVLVISIGCL